MPRIEPFQQHPDRYDRWFERHSAVSAAEVRALRSLRPPGGRGLAIGVGTGRFGQSLDVEDGVDPSAETRQRAQQQDIRVRAGTAEELPYDDEQFAVALLVTTICFVDDLEQSLAEAHHVLASGGALLIGMIDRESPRGQRYEAEKEGHPFYYAAHFHTMEEEVAAMRAVGFQESAFRQTLVHPLDEVGEQEPVTPGYGEGAFVVIRGHAF